MRQRAPSVSSKLVRIWLAPMAAALLVGSSGPSGQAGSGEPPSSASGGSSPIDVRFAGRDPAIALAADEGVHVVYLDDSQKNLGLTYRRLGPAPAGPVPVSPPDYRLSGDPSAPPVLVLQPHGVLVTLYNAAPPGQYDADVRMQRSADGGRTWSAPQAVHDDREIRSRSFFDAAVSGSGAVIVTWLDDRDGRQGLRSATIGPDGAVSRNTTADPMVCECCPTDVLAAGDAAWTAYRDLEDGSIRDVALARSDGGTGFVRLGLVSADGWRLNGCPHSGPRLASAGDGTVWVVWFTGAEPGIFVAGSTDGGRSFSPRQPVAVPAGEVRRVANPDVAVLPDGRLIVVYEASGSGRHVVARVRHGASWSEPRVIEAGGAYPRIASDGSRAVVAYTLSGSGAKQVVIRDLALLLKESS